MVLAAEPLLGFFAPALADDFLEDLDAQRDTFVADVDAGAGDQLAQLRAGLTAERAAGRGIGSGRVRECLGDRISRGRDGLVGGGVVGEAGVGVVERRQESLEGAIERLPRFDRPGAQRVLGVELDGRLPVLRGLDPLGRDSGLVERAERGRALARGLAEPAQPRGQAVVRPECPVERGARSCGCGPGLVNLGRRVGGLLARRLRSRPLPRAHQGANGDCGEGDQDDQDGTVNHTQPLWLGTALRTVPLSVEEISEAGVVQRCRCTAFTVGARALAQSERP